MSSTRAGRTGLLFPSGDVPAFCALLKQSLGAPAERAEMAQRAREDVRRRFSSAAMAGHYHALYTKVLAELGRPVRVARVAEAA